jgi:UDP-2,3-diacylglucosamine hydrolase
MTDIFISDLHLSEDQPAISQGFLWFLETQLQGAERLFILGDFFELWIGDDFRTPFHTDIIEALKRVTMPIFIMHGNRDFLLGEHFCEEIGAMLLPDPTVMDIGGEQVLLMHGDSLCTDDTEYMQVRGLLRSEAFQADFLSKSPEERLAFAQNARAQSQAHTSETAAEIMDVNQTEVAKALEESKALILIHGHTHRPGVHELQSSDGDCRRYVLGDWSSQTGWRITSADTGLELEEFEFGD